MTAPSRSQLARKTGQPLHRLRERLGRAFLELMRRRRRVRLEVEQLDDRTLPSVVTVGTEFPINTFTSDIQQTSAPSSQAVAMQKNGDYVVVWTSAGQDGSGQGIFAQRFQA